MNESCCEKSIAAGLDNSERCPKPLNSIKSPGSTSVKLKEYIRDSLKGELSRIEFSLSIFRTLNKKISKEVVHTTNSESSAFTNNQSMSNIQRSRRYTASRIVVMPVPMASGSQTNDIFQEVHKHQMFRNRRTNNVEPTPRDIFAPETKKEVAFRSKSLNPPKV